MLEQQKRFQEQISRHDELERKNMQPSVLNDKPAKDSK
jgi:hypothetical protein